MLHNNACVLESGEVMIAKGSVFGEKQHSHFSNFPKHHLTGIKDQEVLRNIISASLVEIIG